MRQFFGRSVSLLALGLIAGTLWGCADTRSAGLLASWPPWREKDEIPPGVETPQQRIERIELLAQEANGAAAAEQHRIALELAQMIRAERVSLVRLQIVQGLGTNPSEPAAAVLRAALEDPESDVRVATCRAWGTRGGPEAVQLLSETLSRDSDVDVRLTAADELGTLGDPGGLPALKIALEDSDPALQRRAMASLRSVTGREYGENVNYWREYLNGGDPQVESPSLVERVGRLF